VRRDNLRWDSTRRVPALAESLDHLARARHNSKAKVFRADSATRPTHVPRHDNSLLSIWSKAGHARQPLLSPLYWAEALAAQTQDPELQSRFAKEVASTGGARGPGSSPS